MQRIDLYGCMVVIVTNYTMVNGVVFVTAFLPWAHIDDQCRLCYHAQWSVPRSVDMDEDDLVPAAYVCTNLACVD